MPKRIIAASLLLTFTVASCRTWTPMETVPDPMPEEVRIELLSGERVVVMDSRSEADTLVGRLPGGERSVLIPTDQIAGLATAEVASGSTTLLVLGIGLVAAFLVLAKSWEEGGFDLGRGHRVPSPGGV